VHVSKSSYNPGLRPDPRLGPATMTFGKHRTAGWELRQGFVRRGFERNPAVASLGPGSAKSGHPGGLFAEQVSVSASRPLRAGLGAWHRSCSCSCNSPLLSPPHLQETREGTVHAAAYAATRIERPVPAVARDSHR
jgi:hypothetical protein